MMARIYNVRFIDKRGEQFDFCQFKVAENEVMGNVLEEILYIASEIVPIHRNWKKDLQNDGKCLFTYHHVQDCVVEFKNGEFIVTDI